ncbi:MAG: DUF1670 domain-containing protein [Candidatus Hodarchaeota archaeon]
MNVPNMIQRKVNSGLNDSILHLIREDYQFITGDKMQKMFADEVVKIVEKSRKNESQLDVGQILWYGVSINDKPNYSKSSNMTELKPIILTLISDEDLNKKANGFSDKEILPDKVVRLFNEAYAQKTVITHADVAFLLNISTGAVSKILKAYMEENKIIVPTRGIIHDIGRATTHKKIILNYYLSGYQTLEIARLTNHTEEACDRYIKTAKRVQKLKPKMDIDGIADVLGVSKSLVKEYMVILDEHDKNIQQKEGDLREN